MITTQELEKLLFTFNTAAAASEELIRVSNELIESNRALKARIDTDAYLKVAKGDLVKNLNEQNILNRSLLYLLMNDKEVVNEIVAKAIEYSDHDIVTYWSGRLNR